MKQENWKKVKEIFDGALLLDSSDRRKYVETAAASDPEIIAEVNTLLDSYNSKFLESTAVAEVAELIVTPDADQRLSPDQQLSHYRIVSHIGSGGMGEVYLARDTKLNRSVALKVLNAASSSDHERVSRFMHEAQAASALNHPNICTIYDIHDEDRVPFIAMEYVPGDTLAKRIRAGGLTLGLKLDIAIQVAKAITAAHEAGIVHRDIKPENIILRSDGLVKVLDFGLAKLTTGLGGVDHEARTVAHMTNPGMVVGTVSYMSPEQARGKDIDPRTDIFSFGVMLYEMLSGELPFKGENEFDIIGSILHSEHKPLGQLTTGLPPKLERIVEKALKKDRDERYLHTGELLNELRIVRESMRSDSGAENAALRVTQEFPYDETTADQLERHRTTARQPEFQTGNFSGVIFSKLRKGPIPIVSMLLLGLVVVSGYMLLRWSSRRATPLASQPILEQITDSGMVKANLIAISRDGGSIAFVAYDENKNESLYLKRFGADPQLLVSSVEGRLFESVTFSPNGNDIYYTQGQKADAPSIFRVKSHGGTPEKLIEQGWGPVTFSPTADRIGYLDSSTGITIADTDGNQITKLINLSDGRRWKALAWSPDGQKIVGSVYSAASDRNQLVEFAIDNPSALRQVGGDWHAVNDLQWRIDGSGLLVAGSFEKSAPGQIWFISYPEGEHRQLTFDLTGKGRVSVTADGRSAVMTQAKIVTNISVIDATTFREISNIPAQVGTAEGQSGLALTPDNRIVFTSQTANSQSLWIMDADGKNRKKLTINSRKNFNPSVSPNGRHIVYVSTETGNAELWRMNIDGSEPLQLTNTSGIEGNPDFMPDGKTILYDVMDDSSRTTVWKIGIDGSNPSRLTDDEAGYPDVSPDGSFFVSDFGDVADRTPVRMAVFSLTEPNSFRVLNFPAVAQSRNFVWDRTGTSLIYSVNENRGGNLWQQQMVGGRPKKLTDFRLDTIYHLDMSKDGKVLAISKGRSNSDAVLLTNLE